MHLLPINTLPTRAIRKITGAKPPEEFDPEWRVAALLCDPSKLSLDVGADQGKFARLLAKHSKKCVAFEPRAIQAAQIISALEQWSLPIEVQPVALSNASGVVTMRVLDRDPGRSTIDAANALDDPDGSPMKTVRVPVLRLDDYGFQDVGLLKVDVEGHELAVLQGGAQTIRRSLPPIYIEVEERHNAGAIEAVRLFLYGFGYRGFFINNGGVCPIESFDHRTHQNPKNIGGWKDKWTKYGTYINNFFFVHSDDGAVIESKARAAGAI